MRFASGLLPHKWNCDPWPNQRDAVEPGWRETVRIYRDFGPNCFLGAVSAFLDRSFDARDGCLQKRDSRWNQHLDSERSLWDWKPVASDDFNFELVAGIRARVDSA